jgi:hypothetical protein
VVALLCPAGSKFKECFGAWTGGFEDVLNRAGGKPIWIQVGNPSMVATHDMARLVEVNELGRCCGDRGPKVVQVPCCGSGETLKNRESCCHLSFTFSPFFIFSHQPTIFLFTLLRDSILSAYAPKVSDTGKKSFPSPSSPGCNLRSSPLMKRYLLMGILQHVKPH